MEMEEEEKIEKVMDEEEEMEEGSFRRPSFL